MAFGIHGRNIQEDTLTGVLLFLPYTSALCYNLHEVIVLAKKYKVIVRSGGKDRIVRFGAKGYSISPGTPKGDNYCARSSGIKTSKGNLSPNFHARGIWGCKGNKSSKARARAYKARYKPTRT